jgi:hypothetical protein
MGRGYMTLPSESAAEIAELRLRVAALERQAGVRDTAYLLALLRQLLALGCGTPRWCLRRP